MISRIHDNFSYGPKGGLCELEIVSMSLVKLQKMIGKCQLTKVPCHDDSLEIGPHETLRFQY